MKTLLPNATKLEIALAATGAYAFQQPSLTLIQDFDLVPEDFLPALAWQESVDYWDHKFVSLIKRELIKKSRQQHKIKGTAAAIRRALEPFGYEVKLVEWFQAQPNLTPGTFNLELDLIGKSLDQEVYNEVNRLVSDAKSASRHLGNLTIATNPIGKTKIILVHQTAITFSSEPRV